MSFEVMYWMCCSMVNVVNSRTEKGGERQNVQRADNGEAVIP